MKLKEFLQDSISPSKGAVKIPIKGMIEQYRERYKNLLDSGAKFRFQIYKTSGENGRTFVHVKVPSETVGNFYYDVLMEFDIGKSTKNIEDCDIRIFSNCPSFVYTYAYVFYHLGESAPTNKSNKKPSGLLIGFLSKKIPNDRLLIPGTEAKLGDDVINNPPVVRNPAGLPLFDKSIYHAIFFIQDNLTVRQIVQGRAYRTEEQIIDSVSDFDTLMAKRKQAADRANREKRREIKEKENAVRATERTVASENRIVRKVKPLAPKKPTAAVKTVSSNSVHRVGAKK